MAKNNNILSTLLSQSLELEPLRQRRSSAVESYELIRTHAHTLYQEMKKRWTCNCSHAHKVRLRLDARSKNHSRKNNSERVSFNLIFCTRNKVGTSWTEQATSICQAAGFNEFDGSDLVAEAGSLPEKKKRPPILKSLFSRKSKAKLSPASVKFAESYASSGQSSRTTLVEDTGPEIEDLCKAFSSLASPPHHGMCIGHLTCETESILAVIVSPPNSGAGEYSNLSSFLSSRREFRISRGDRYGLALTIASSVLQLSPTRWLPESWDKADIQVLLQGERATGIGKGTSLDYSKRLYVEKEFPETEDEETISTGNVFPGLRNPALFRLGIVLIELCLGETLESLRTPEDPLDKEGKSNILTEWATASRLIHDVSREAGNRYGDAVRRCIYCDFDQRSTSFSNAAFRHAVYEGIIVPLHDINEDYNLAFVEDS